MFKKHFYALILLILSGLISGCFETEFDFKTIVHQDGSVFRETRIDGRGANLFKMPDGPGWQAKSWETKGEETLLVNTYHHILSSGRFQSGQAIPSDYVFDLERMSKNWDDEDKKRLEAAGIKTPYEENIYSRNQIQIKKVQGWFLQTFIYEETYQTAGLVELLSLDLKEEIKKQNEHRADILDEAEINSLVRIRLEDEFLSQIRFQSEVLLPGRIVSSNASRTEGGKAFWKFSAEDFQENYSVYSLKAVSRSLNLMGVIILIGAGLAVLIVIALLIAGIAKAVHGKRPKRKKNREEEKS